jgi:hypothetical protein
MDEVAVGLLFDVSQTVIGTFQSRNFGKSYVSSYLFRRGVVASDLH